MSQAEAAFQKFTYKGRIRAAQGKQLTSQQKVIFDLARDGMTAKEISSITDIRIGCVYDGLIKIRDRGWDI